MTYATGEHCEMYVKHFEGLFGTDALAEMVAASWWLLNTQMQELVQEQFFK